MTIEIIEMLEQSGIMALVGMAIVFSFLIIMVFAITLTGKIIGRFTKPEAVLTQSPSPNAIGGGAVTAAITAAVNEYRKNN